MKICFFSMSSVLCPGQVFDRLDADKDGLYTIADYHEVSTEVGVHWFEISFQWCNV